MLLKDRIESLPPSERHKIVAALRGEQERRAAQGSGASLETPSATPAPVLAGTAQPLSFAQQRIWFLEQLEGPSPAFTNPTATRLRGPLDVAALDRALTELARRHDCLRARFEVLDDRPVQRIDSQNPFQMQHSDLSALPEGERDAALARAVRAEADFTFDLRVDPLLRARLIKLAPEDHVLLFNIHHIAFDGWSRGVLVREVSALYAAFREGRASPLPGLPIQYSDFVAWQRRCAETEDFQAQLRYWTTHLAGSAPALALPFDRSERSGASPGTKFWHPLGRDLTRRVKEYGRSTGTTPFMVLLSGFKILLLRYSGQSDIVVGSPIANRPREELESLIGCFVNLLVLRTDLSGDPCFQDALMRVKETALGAYAHQDLPFERLVEQLGAERRWGHSPLFQVLFVLHNAPGQPLALPGLRIDEVELEERTAKYDLSLQIREGAEGFEEIWEYSTELFDESTIRQLSRHYRQLLEAGLSEPHRSVWQLPLLSPAERESVLKWGQGAVSEPSAALLHEWFEEQVARTPQAQAVVCGEQQCTYAELNGRANRVAGFLRARGVGPDVTVGLCVERGIPMLIGMLGILKAGGAYVPLDPQYPPERLAYLLEDAAPKLTLIEDALRARLPAHAESIALDRQWETIERYPDENLPRSGLDPSHLAYLIYTSGSTGAPKGVMIEHRQVSNFIHWCGSAFSPAEFECTLCATSLNADLSVFECFAPLAVGGTIYIVQNLLSLLEQSLPVTLVNTVPSAIASVLEVRALPKTVSVVNLAGEVLVPSLVEQLFAKTTIDYVCNLYGPSETTTYSTWVRMPRSEGYRSGVGHAIERTSIYLLNPQGELVPRGVAAEICIGGAGVARGYLNREALTAERFAIDRFATQEGARLYRTGDFGRWTADGTLCFLGRRDDQVKIRGFRIELGEIQTQLTRQPAVRESAVLARADHAGELRLIAYVVLAEMAEADWDRVREELKRALRACLPEYMVPAVFVPLERMPLTPNGKTDRHALPAPETLAVRPRESGPPQGAAEAQLATLWQELLGVAHLGRDDNFFELGGHSLRAVSLVERIRETMGVSLPVASVFQFPTLREMAELLRRTPGSASDLGTDAGAIEEGLLDPTVPERSARTGGFAARLKRAFGGRSPRPRPEAMREEGGEPSTRLLQVLHPTGSATPIVFVPSYDGDCHRYRPLIEVFSGEAPMYALHLPLEASSAATLQDLAARHLPALRHTLPRGFRLMGFNMGGLLALEIAQQWGDARAAHVRLLALETHPVGALLARDPDEAPELAGVLDARREATRRYRSRLYEGDLRLILALQGEALAQAASTQWEGCVRGALHVQVLPGNASTLIEGANLPVVAEALRELDREAHAAHVPLAS